MRARLRRGQGCAGARPDLVHCGPMRAPGLLVLLSVLAGCGSDPKITGVRVYAAFGDPRFDQLEFNLAIDGVSQGTFIAPAPAKELLPSPQDLVFYGPDAWAGKTATCSLLLQARMFTG